MMDLKNHVSSMLEQLDALRYTELRELDMLEYRKADGYKHGHEAPKEGYSPLTPVTPLQGYDEHFWIRGSFATPKAKAGTEYIIKLTTNRDDTNDATNPQSIIYLNGKMTQGADINHREIFLEADTSYDFVDYFYIGTIEDTVYFDARLMSLDTRVEKLYYDVKVPYDAYLTMDPASVEATSIIEALSETVRLLDLRAPYSEGFYAALDRAQDYITREFYEKQCTPTGKPTVVCIGHTHIDVEWLWTRYQTREKIQRSFATAKALMDRYPEYNFMLSQPELYRYLKEEAPEKYEELKQLVKEGRWEPEGSMYLEADCNVTSGESFVRQILQGKKFFRDEFGVENTILFLPDVFGYSAALPQILKKCGITHFVTQKIGWNDTNTLPYDRFVWQGIDGSEIFTTFYTTQNHDHKRWRESTYVGMLSPSQVKGSWNRLQQKTYTDTVFTTFGFGDGGGGPTKEMLETQRRLAHGIPAMPVTKMGLLRPYLDEEKARFEEHAKRTGRTPKWVGELYLEFHRGTYTSIGKNKRANRKAEFGLETLEALSAGASLFGGKYEAKAIYDNWTRVLHNQFHDIIPGSSIKPVYDITDVDYREISEFYTEGAKSQLEFLAKGTKKSGTLVYNPLGFARKAPVVIDGTCYEPDEEIPPYGWRVIDGARAESGVKLNGLTAENDYYKMTLTESGRISSLYDKRAGREVFLAGEEGNAIAAFADYPYTCDNWEIRDYYKETRYDINDKAEIKPIVCGTRAGFEVTRKYFGSTLTQRIWLYTSTPRIDFDNDIDWHEHHQVLKVFFPFDVHSTKATYDVQFGHVERATNRNTSWQQAQFEVYAHKWVDVAEHGYGVALLNDCKYGHSIEGSTLALTLLKCGTNPNTEADIGRHIITYSLMPHTGDFREAGVIREAFSLNVPLMAEKASGKGAGVPDEFSLVGSDNENVFFTAVKQAEDGTGLVARFYDGFDEKSRVTINVAKDYTRAFVCDMLENEERELPVNNGAVTLDVSNFEIVTLKFKK